MAVTKDMLVSELQNLLHLTSFEQTIAAVRRTQAASAPVAEELKANYAKSVERGQLISDALRQVGGVPDVVGSVMSKAGALVTTQVNQVQTLQGALLGDLALEHQLRERARYARTLAESLGYPQLMPLFDRLEVAHTATIEWLEERLTELGRTGTSALQATPVQAAVGVVRRLAGSPFSVLAAGINRGTALLQRGASTATSSVGTAAEAVSERAQQVAGSVTETSSTAAGAVADTASTAAGTVSDTAGSAAEAVSGTAEAGAEAVSDTAAAAAATAPEIDQVLDLTDVDEDKPPFAGYASLSGDSVMRHVRDTDDVEHLREILAFEQAHKARKGVLGALEERLSELVGASA